MVSETPATARLSHVGHRRGPTLSNQIAGKDRRTCPRVWGSRLPLPMSWEVTGIRTCLRSGSRPSRARHTYLYSLTALAEPPKKKRPGPAGAAAAGRQRRRALGHLARQIAAHARRALVRPALPSGARVRGLRGRLSRAPGAACPPTPSVAALRSTCGAQGRGGCGVRPDSLRALLLAYRRRSSSRARGPLPGDDSSEVLEGSSPGLCGRGVAVPGSCGDVDPGDTARDRVGGVPVAWQCLACLAMPCFVGVGLAEATLPEALHVQAVCVMCVCVVCV